MKNTKVKLLAALFFGTITLMSCKDLIDIIPKKGGGGGGSGTTEQCERKGTIVKEVYGGTNRHTGNYLVLDKKTNEHYYPNSQNGQDALKEAYSETGNKEISYGYSEINKQCLRPSIWVTPDAPTCISLSCLNGKEIEPDGCKGGDALTNKGEVEILSCGVIIHSIDRFGKAIIIEPINTPNNFVYKDGQKVMLDYLFVDTFLQTPCSQSTNTPTTPVEITQIIEIK